MCRQKIQVYWSLVHCIWQGQVLYSPKVASSIPHGLNFPSIDFLMIMSALVIRGNLHFMIVVFIRHSNINVYLCILKYQLYLEGLGVTTKQL